MKWTMCARARVFSNVHALLLFYFYFLFTLFLIHFRLIDCFFSLLLFLLIFNCNLIIVVRLICQRLDTEKKTMSIPDRSNKERECVWSLILVNIEAINLFIQFCALFYQNNKSHFLSFIFNKMIHQRWLYFFFSILNMKYFSG